MSGLSISHTEMVVSAGSPSEPVRFLSFGTAAGDTPLRGRLHSEFLRHNLGALSHLLYISLDREGVHVKGRPSECRRVMFTSRATSAVEVLLYCRTCSLAHTDMCLPS